VATGKPIGQTLSAGSWFEGKDPEFKFTCFSFSHNGKYVVTGSSFHMPSSSKFNAPISVGHLEVWDAATGERIEANPHLTGSVRSFNFSDDDQTIYYDAERFHRENS
jgi:WD40 repeat protein